MYFFSFWCVSLIALFRFAQGKTKEFRAYPLREGRQAETTKKCKAGDEQKGMLAMSQKREDFSVFQFKLSPWERVGKWDEDDANFGMIVVSLSTRTSSERQTFPLFCRNRQVSFSRLIKL